MIKCIKVEKLYGEFNHVIYLNSKGITLILGENGLGKTIVLKLIKSLFTSDYSELLEYDFSKFIIEFSDDAILELTKINAKNNIRLDFKLKSKSSKPISSSINHELNRSDSKFDSELLRFYFNHYSNIDKNLFIRHNDNNSDTLKQTLLKSNANLDKRIIKYLENINVKLVETQRLLFRDDSGKNKYHETVVINSDLLIDKLNSVVIKATNLATSLDRSYTNRLIDNLQNSPKKRTIPEIMESLKELEVKRGQLYKVGLLEEGEEALSPINFGDLYSNDKNYETILDVFNIYIDDSYAKLEVYESLRVKLDTLLNIMNKRFTYKKLFISKKDGFIIKSLKTDKVIPLSNLSSGEQHILVLFYELLFNTEKNSLILIDEPEISLHINWQNEFINDLIVIKEMIGFESIIATHSPDIIFDNWDLTIQLK